jgi:7-cyano-7-deazaguanine synthase
MDSSSLLLHLLANGYKVTALGFDYGQKHTVELQRAVALVDYINDIWSANHPPFDNDKNYSWYPVTHQIIKLDGLSQLLNSALVTGGADVPEGHYEQDNMKETVVPNRNKIFSSIIQAVALSVATKGEKQECAIALGVHSGDHQIYPDCTANFRDIDMEAFRAGNWDSELVYFYTPYMEGNKYTILQDGLACCNKLGFDFDEVYSRTNTSYKPIKLTDDIWLSDYKSAASVERVEAFIKLGRPDPVQYGELLEGGGIRTVKWNEVVSHVTKVLEDYKNK